MNKKLLISCLILVVAIVGVWLLLKYKNTTPDSITNTNTNTTMTTATLHTTEGDITIELLPNLAPKTVENFITLAKSDYYNGIKFHRVIKDFMNQAGDPLTKDDSKMAMWGTGGPGYKFDDEITPDSKNELGTVAMANAGPNTNGSQFFINAKDNAFLNGGYTVFGKVTKGMDVVMKINTVATDRNDRPLTPVVINSITLQ
jgi:cyclophilin family peptidyl-prolyl cis-trans isomerase